MEFDEVVPVPPGSTRPGAPAPPRALPPMVPGTFPEAPQPPPMDPHLIDLPPPFADPTACAASASKGRPVPRMEGCTSKNSDGSIEYVDPERIEPELGQVEEVRMSKSKSLTAPPTFRADSNVSLPTAGSSTRPIGRCRAATTTLTVEGSRRSLTGGSSSGSAIEAARQVAYSLAQLGDADAIREKVQRTQAAAHSSYQVQECYHTTGVCQAIARDARFENVTLFVIACNALWIGFDTDHNSASLITGFDTGFIVGDALFFTYFSAELAIRFGAFRRKLDAFMDAWFVFDMCLVALYAVDPFMMPAFVPSGGQPDTSILRLLRLARLSRLVRLFRAVPEMMILFKGMATAAATVSYTLCLMIVVTYMFGIVLTLLAPLGDCKEEYLSSVPHSMYSLIIHALFLDDAADFANAVKKASTPCLLVVGIYVVLANMTFLNLLVGMMCAVIADVATEERETMVTQKVYADFREIVRHLDQNEDGMISQQEFTEIIQMKDAVQALESVRVPPDVLLDFALDWFEETGGQLRLDEFFAMVLSLRESKDVTLKDIMALKKKMKRHLTTVNIQVDAIEEKVSRLTAAARRRHGPRKR